MRAISAPSASTSRSSAASSRRNPARAASASVAFEIETARLENQRDARSGVLQVSGQRRRIAGWSIAVLVVAGHLAARQHGFRVDDPDETLGGEERERPRIVESFGERPFGQVVLGDGTFGESGGESLFQAAAVVSFGAEQQHRRRRAALLDACDQLRRGHG
jgi:hypothetical protein